ncbi:MAG: flagellar motor switch protein FliN [Deltaproteobacteria bacterium]|nr:flagellar motor switch protein FliN [Deltaproteobacteria bacterium]
MADSGELDFSNMEGMDDIDWSDVESELQQNREMITQEATPGGDELAEFGGDELEGESDEGPQEIDISFLLDIPLSVTVEVGRARFYIKDLLELNLNSIIELKKKVGDPLSVLVNDKLVAKGEVVIQNEKFAIKIVEIIDENVRLKKLKIT